MRLLDDLCSIVRPGNTVGDFGYAAHDGAAHRQSALPWVRPTRSGPWPVTRTRTRSASLSRTSMLGRSSHHDRSTFLAARAGPRRHLLKHPPPCERWSRYSSITGSCNPGRATIQRCSNPDLDASRRKHGRLGADQSRRLPQRLRNQMQCAHQPGADSQPECLHLCRTRPVAWHVLLWC